MRVVDEVDPDVRLINLETTITMGSEFAAGKAVHYRMHPGNAACLTAAGIHCAGAGLDAASVDRSDSTLAELRMMPMWMRCMRFECAPRADADWLRRTLVTVSRRFGTQVGADGAVLVI